MAARWKIQANRAARKERRRNIKRELTERYEAGIKEGSKRTSPTPDERYVRRLIAIQAASRASTILRDLGWELYDWGTAQLVCDNLLKLALNSEDPPSVFLEGMKATFKRAQDVRARDRFIKGKCWRRRRLKRSRA